MKTVILAGGFGTRISEESQFRPKPMLEIGEMPILWHIMKEYSHYGFNDFIICAGYKQHVIKEWFEDYFLHTSDVTFDYTPLEYTRFPSAHKTAASVYQLLQKNCASHVPTLPADLPDRFPYIPATAVSL